MTKLHKDLLKQGMNQLIGGSFCKVAQDNAKLVLENLDDQGMVDHHLKIMKDYTKDKLTIQVLDWIDEEVRKG